MLHQLLDITAVLQQLDQMAQIDQRIAPAGRSLGLGVETIALVLVAPVGGDAVLGHPVHGLGADLHLDAHAAGADHRGVDRAIVVPLGRGDVVLEPLGHAGPRPMDDAQGAVAVLLGIDDHPKGVDVRELRKADRFALQLPPDGKGVLLAAKHPGRDAGGGQLGGDLARDHRDRPAMLLAQGLQPAADGVAGHRIQVQEGQLLQLGADAVAADGARQGRIDFQGLAGDPLTLGRVLDELQRAHVVQAVGQLDHQDAHVLGDGQDELPQVLGLAGVFGIAFQLGKLGHALHQLADLFAEQLVDVGPADRTVLDHVVQQGRDDGRGVETVVGEDARHLDGVGEIGIAGRPLLRAVHAHGVDIGAVQQRLVGGRVVGPDLVDQFVLAKQLGRTRRNRRVLGLGDGWGRLDSKRVCAFGAQYRSS